MMDVMQSIQETLRVRFKTDIALVQRFLKLAVFGVKRVLTVGAKGVALQKERMRRIADNVVIRILAALRDDGFRRQNAIVVPQAKIFGNIPGVADFL